MPIFLFFSTFDMFLTSFFQELHLQEAIKAQKASSAGAQIGNHAIPIPKVAPIDTDVYNGLYAEASTSGKRDKKYIVFKGRNTIKKDYFTTEKKLKIGFSALKMLIFDLKWLF